MTFSGKVGKVVYMRTMKNQPGDWVAVKAPGSPGGYKPGKVVSATSESVTVELRFEGSTTLQTFDSPQPRIRWRRQNGRSRWTFA